MVIIYLLFLLTALSAWLIKNELIVTALHALILAVLISLTKVKVVNIVVFAVCITLALYISARIYRLFTFNNTMYTIPLWIPFTWAIVGIFAYTLLNLNVTKK